MFRAFKGACAILALSFFASASNTSAVPSIRSLLKPVVYEKITSISRESVTSTDLSPSKTQEGFKDYSLYGVMLVRASLRQTHDILTDYPLYAKMIPYVERSAYDPAHHSLSITGGIWKFQMSSEVSFEEKSPRWIHYRVIGGSFTGMEGDMMFEAFEDKGTLVFIQAKSQGKEWPPAFIVERGAEIVFGFAGKKMRSFIEEQKREIPTPEPGKPEVPRPTQRLNSSTP